MREVVGENHLKKWLAVRDEYCVDFEALKAKIKKFRQSGLESGGEYSYENLTFKLLRRNGYIEKLMGIKTSLRDKKLSLPQ